jgi:hypothetical protein
MSSLAAGWEVVGVVEAGLAAAAGGSGNCGPPRWRTFCTRSLTRNMDSPGRCKSGNSRVNDWREAVGGWESGN